MTVTVREELFRIFTQPPFSVGQKFAVYDGIYTRLLFYHSEKIPEKGESDYEKV